MYACMHACMGSTLRGTAQRSCSVRSVCLSVCLLARQGIKGGLSKWTAGEEERRGEEIERGEKGVLLNKNNKKMI